MHARYDRELELSRLPLPRLWPLGTAINGKPLHPGVDILGAIDLTGLVDFSIGRKRFFDEAANLFLIRGVPFDRFNNQAVSRTPGLLGECAKPRA
jgi:hypothetical protein